MTVSKSEKLKYCVGCKDDFYNGKNDLDVKECWGLKTAKVKTMFRIEWWTPHDNKDNFTKVTTLDCHKETGSFAFYPELPRHLRRSK